MSQSSKKIEDVYEEFNNQADRINYLIKRFTELKETICKYKKIRNYWESHYSTLSMNIWAGQVKYLELQKKETNLRNEISEMIEIIKFQQQELKNLTKERTIYFTKQCDKFRIMDMKYTNNFLRAQKEYSNENLIKDIQEFQKKYEKIYSELPILKEKLIKLKTLCDLNDLNSKKETEEILKINLVLTN
ncbi:uncharacterized protein LOC113218845, partial [Apis mellifera]|uniref:Uncharacterized protein LOC113218845 n=1 Tax=Apis mellifera TaxID=7460 RepID=A0A7M7L3N6_APIME